MKQQLSRQPMPAPTIQKSLLRRELLASRQAIPPEVRSVLDTAIGERLLVWWEMHRAGTIGVYWPIRGEPDLRAVYTEFVKRGVRLALPVVADRNAPLRFIAWKPGDPMVKDSFGVAIPLAGEEVQPGVLLIPCVGFNEKCFRLGYGGGFYDRTLAIEPRPVTVGIGYEIARSQFDADVHDIALDTLVTETSLIEAC